MNPGQFLEHSFGLRNKTDYLERADVWSCTVKVSPHLANLCIKIKLDLSFNSTAAVVQTLMKSPISTTVKEIVVYCAVVVRLNLNFPSLCLTMTLLKYHMIVKPPVFIQIHHGNTENQGAERFLFHHLLSAEHVCEAAGAGNRISAPQKLQHSLRRTVRGVCSFRPFAESQHQLKAENNHMSH